METLNYSALLTVWWEKGTETMVWSEVPSFSQRLWRNESKGCCCPLFQGVLVVCELDVLPADVLQVVLLLLQLEDVPYEELLQVLVGKVDA
jgi:hypothetical protein